MNEDDSDAALAHQAELENWQRELQKDPFYEMWLATEIAWWKYLDNDPNWIRDYDY